jgi:RNA polymerase sigma-70 factor (ECF subfamily)
VYQPLGRADGRGVLGDDFPQTLARAATGDAQAFAVVWRETQPMLLRYLRLIAGADAEDIAQQTWLAVIEGLAGFAGTEPGFRRWVVTIARNIHVDQVRRKVRHPEDLTAMPVLEPADDATADVADVVAERLSTEWALQLIATLPPAQREMVALRVIAGLDVGEVAALVGRSPGAVRVAVHRGLTRLREQLDPTSTGVTQDGTEAFSRGHV